jgi:xanthine dehydrogenase accessory factor
MRSHLKEAREAWAEVKAAYARGRTAVLCEVVAVEGSAYRRPGALMMMASDGHMWGTVSGGCLEGDLYIRAEPVMAGGPPIVVDYDLAEDDMWTLGIGCKGKIKVWVRRVDPDSAAGRELERQLETGGVIAVRLPDGKPLVWTPDRPWAEAGEWASPMRAAWEGAEPAVRDGVYVRAWRPPDRLVVVGAGHDAEPVVKLALEAGFEVAVLDPRPSFNHARRFPGAEHWVTEADALSLDARPEARGAYWVVMNHHKDRDRRALRAIARLEPKWVGALGPWRRTAELLEDVDPAYAETVHGPLGLDIGADTPFEVAISIVAQLMAESRGRSGGSLNRQAVLHG